MRAKKIVVILEVMWGLRGDKPLRWFSINPYNHSGRRLNDIISTRYLVTNACPDVVSLAKGRGTPNRHWLAANLKALCPDVVLVCGRVAQATFQRHMAPQAKILKMPHPAARTWSKANIAQAQRRVSKALACWDSKLTANDRGAVLRIT